MIPRTRPKYHSPQLESFLMKAADILRGKMDASDSKFIFACLLKSDCPTSSISSVLIFEK
jgi:type I restriction-modification system DNA methylase subunit